MNTYITYISVEIYQKYFYFKNDFVIFANSLQHKYKNPNTNTSQMTELICKRCHACTVLPFLIINFVKLFQLV